jgi:hypothetical protein
LKGEKAKVLRVDKQKEEVVVSLLGAVVPLPVAIKLDNVKVVRREDDIKLLVDGGAMKPGPALSQKLGPLGIPIIKSFKK